MTAWEEDLRQRYEQDRIRLLDYREADLEFKILIFETIRKEVNEDERSEHDLVDGTVCDDRICDGECIRTEQSEDDVPGSDREIDEWTQGDSEGERPDEIAITDEYDIYELMYDQIAMDKIERKVSPKKPKHKRK